MKKNFLLILLSLILLGCSNEKVHEEFFDEKVKLEVESIYLSLSMNEILEEILEEEVLSFSNAYLLSEKARSLFNSHEELVKLMRNMNDVDSERAESSSAIGVLHYATDILSRNMIEPRKLDDSSLEIFKAMQSIVEYWSNEIPLQKGIIKLESHFVIKDEYWEHTFEDDFWRIATSFFHEDNESLEFNSNVSHLQQALQKNW
ncbi:hypothetical protein [Bacillus sp. FJAT-45066]|uniref:hypothetical protein n=1 Tax=Bacillus sp. FJAT-45066 TaxID=2011010 RepID=UPI000BB86906|nr:hypothetical protein [Bacillus sp. FJAT-45066]